MHYLCTRFDNETMVAASDGPFVYRLGRQIFILERGVRFSYGLQVKKYYNKINRLVRWQIINHL